MPPNDLLALQRTVGNRATQRMLQNRPTVQRAPMQPPQAVAQDVVQRTPTQLPQVGVQNMIQRAPTKPSLVGAKDAEYMQRANAFEERLGYYTFNHPKAKGAADTSVNKMFDVLVGAAPQGNEDDVAWQQTLATTFGRDNTSSAGQVGQAFAPVSEVLLNGNLREQMTAFYNAAYGGFKRTIIDGMRGKAWDDLTAKDLNVPAIKERRKFLGKKTAQKEMFLSASNPMHRGGLGKFTKNNMFWQSFTRKRNADPYSKRTPDDLKGYGENGAQFGAELSDREQQFLYKDRDASETLPWMEGGTASRAKDNFFSGWVKKATTQLKMPVKTGPSGTTDRMLDTFRFLKAGVPAVDFRLALLAWMLTGNDHSFHEIMAVAAEKGLGLDYTPGPTAYMHIKPLTEGELRSSVAAKGRFPHEVGYYANVKAGAYQVIPTAIKDEAKQKLKKLDPADAPGSENISKATMAALYSYTLGGYKLQNALLQWGPLGKVGVKKALNTIYWHKTQYDDYMERVKAASSPLQKTALEEQAKDEGKFDELGTLYKLAQDFKDGTVKIGDIVKETKAHNAMTGQALDKLKPYQGLVYRGTTDWKRRKVGDTITLDAFVSTSLDIDVAKGFAEDATPGIGKEAVIMEMDSRTGRNIAELSALGESEILFKPNTKFTVVDKKKPGSTGYTHLLLTEGAASPNQQKLEKTGALSRRDKAFFTLRLAIQTENAVRGEGTLGEFGGSLFGKPLFSHGWLELDLHSRYKNLAALENDEDEGGEIIYNALEASTKAELQANKKTSIGMYSRGLREPESGMYAGKATGSKAYVLDGVNQTLSFLNFVRNRRKVTAPLWAAKDAATDDRTKKQLDKKLRKAANFSWIGYNCTTFAIEAVRAAGHEPGDVRNRLFLGASDPTKLYKQLYMQEQLGDKSVTTAAMGEQYGWQTDPHQNQLGKARDLRQLSKKDQRKLDKRVQQHQQAQLFAPVEDEVLDDQADDGTDATAAPPTNDHWLSDAIPYGTPFSCDLDVLTGLLGAELAQPKYAPFIDADTNTFSFKSGWNKNDASVVLENANDTMPVPIKDATESKTLYLKVNVVKAAILAGPTASGDETSEDESEAAPATNPLAIQLTAGMQLSANLDVLNLSPDEMKDAAVCIDQAANTFTGTVLYDEDDPLNLMLDFYNVGVKGPKGIVLLPASIIKKVVAAGPATTSASSSAAASSVADDATLDDDSEEDDDDGSLLVAEHEGEAASHASGTETDVDEDDDGSLLVAEHEGEAAPHMLNSTPTESDDRAERRFFDMLDNGISFNDVLFNADFEQQMLKLLKAGKIKQLAAGFGISVDELQEQLARAGYNVERL